MVLPLFIYVMQAAMETLAKLDASRRKPEFRFFPKQKGRLTNQLNKTIQGTESFEMMDVLFIDDTAIICKTREDIKKISQLVLDHLTKFSLQMHTGTKKNKSKMEAMYFLEPVSEAKQQYENLPEPIQLNDGDNNINYMHQLLQMHGINNHY